MIGKTIDEMNVGDAAEMAKTVTETDVYLFAGITGDFNPAHVNEAYAKNTFFKGRIAHGMLSAGFISAVLAMKLPGPGTIYLSQFMEFKAPVRIGDTVTALAYMGGVAIQNMSLLSMLKDDVKDLRDNVWIFKSWF